MRGFSFLNWKKVFYIKCYHVILKSNKRETYKKSWFRNPDYSMNHKRKRFKIFEIRPRLNYDDIIINLIIILNINKYIRAIQID